MLDAPRPISSWFGAIRWRRLAASVCATDTLSTKPMIEISSAGTHSCAIRSGLVEGRANGGNPCGIAPTRLTPRAPRSSASAATMVAATAATGPALATISAACCVRPSRTSSGFNPLRTQNRNSVAGSPIASVQGLIWSMAAAIPPSMAGQVSPPALTPNMCLSWLVAIRIPLAVMKPLMTGCDNRLARKPIRSKPSTASMMPDSAASVIAASR